MLLRWRALAGDEFDDLGRALIAAYEEPQRRYHGIGHVRWLLDETERRAPLIADRDFVAFAIWFHDAIYEPGRPDNEERSAAWAAAALPPGARAERIARVIRMTKDHAKGDADADEALFLDMDIAILGAPREVYAAYANDIRAEFSHVPDPLFNAGRSAFLKSQLARGRLFRTDFYERELASAARHNMILELGALTVGGAAGV